MRPTRVGLALACALVLAVPVHAQKVKLLIPLDSLVARVQRDSNDAPAHYDAALGYWLAKKYDDAEHELREAVAIEPHMAVAYLAMSYLPYARTPRLWKDEDKDQVPAEAIPVLEEAYRLRRRAFILDPLVDLKPLALMIPTPESLAMSKREASYYTALMNGFGAFWDGRYDQAYTFLSDLASGATEDDRQKRFPEWFLWYEGLAAAHVLQYDRAVSDFRILTDRASAREHPDSSAALPFWEVNEYRYALGCMLELSGRPDQAAATLREALAADLGLFMAHVRLAKVYETQHRTKSGLDERRRAVESNPEDPTLRYELGEALAHAGELSEAYGVLEQAAQSNPRNARALYMFAGVAQRLGQNAEAKTAYTRFIAMAPSRFQEQITEAQKRLAAMP